MRLSIVPRSEAVGHMPQIAPAGNHLGRPPKVPNDGGRFLVATGTDEEPDPESHGNTISAMKKASYFITKIPVRGDGVATVRRSQNDDIPVIKLRVNRDITLDEINRQIESAQEVLNLEGLGLGERVVIAKLLDELHQVRIKLAPEQPIVPQLRLVL